MSKPTLAPGHLPLKSSTRNSHQAFKYTPEKDYNGPDSFTYTVKDGKGGEDTATVSITVTAVNDAPDAKDDGPLDAMEDIPLDIPVTTNDTDPDTGDTLSVASNTNPDHGTVSCTGAICTYTPETNYNGSDSFEYTVKDSSGETDTATVSINVVPVNDTPIANPDAYNVDQGQTLSEPAPGVLLDDVDDDSGSTLTARLVSNPKNGTLNLNTDGSFTYTPAKDYSGTDSFTYKANDGTTDSNTATVSITVNPVSVSPPPSQPPPSKHHNKHHNKHNHKKGGHHHHHGGGGGQQGGGISQ